MRDKWEVSNLGLPLCQPVQFSVVISSDTGCTFFNPLYTLRTIRSKNPPYYGALSKLNDHCSHCWLDIFLISGALNRAVSFLEAAVFPLSEITSWCNPRRAANRRKFRIMKASANKSWTVSRWTALETARVLTDMYLLCMSPFSVT